jgi:uncharacterized membrane protein YjjB (DUF3815 family)
MTMAKRKTPPQIVAVEVILLALASVAAYFLSKSTGHSVAVFVAGMACGLATRIFTRHAGPKRKRARRTAGRPAAGRRS